MQPNIPQELTDAEYARQNARDALIERLARARDDNRDAFFAAGGCSRCMGSGRRVIAAYSDGEETYGDRTGWHAGDEQNLPTGQPSTMPAEDMGQAWTGYTRWRVPEDVPCTAGSVAPYTDAIASLSEHVQQEIRDLEESVAMAEEIEAATRRRCTPHVGARVRVVRGRKVKLGTEAVVTWAGIGDDFSERFTRSRDRVGKLRVGIEVDGARVYVDAINVIVVEPSPAIDCPELYGSERQVAWANNLRVQQLRAGMALDIAMVQTAARWWIDNFGQGARKTAEVRT
jgi:hypothetical protein